MAKFKVGDRIIGNSLANKYNYSVEGWTGIVKNIHNDTEFIDAGDYVDLDFNCFDLIKSNNIINMNIIQKFSMMLKGEPEKSFFKAGITNSDYTFTNDGKEIFLQWLLKKNGELFKTEVVDGLLADDTTK